MPATRGDTGQEGRLPDKEGDSQPCAIGAMVFADGHGYAGISCGRYAARYGTAAEPDLTIDPRQKA